MRGTLAPEIPATPRIGPKAGFALQLVAGIVVLAGLLAAVEYVCGRFVHQGTRLERNMEWLKRTAGEGDSVETMIKVLETYPAVNPSPLVTDVFLLWRNEPLAHKTQPVNPQPFGRDDTWTIDNNSEGYRGPERQFTRADDGAFRVLCIGDSVTFGFNVDQDDAYPRQLERLLRERHPGRPIEVVNAGVSGWSWLQGLRFFEVRGGALHPNVVVAAHGTNDRFLPAKNTDAERLGHVDRAVVRRLLRLEAALLRTNTYRFVEQIIPARLRDISVSAGCRRQMREADMCHRLSLTDIRDAVTELAERTRAAGVPLLVMNLDFIRTDAVKGSQPAAARSGVPFLDFVRRFADLYDADTRQRATRLGLLPAADVPGPHRVVLRVVPPRQSATMSVKGYHGTPGSHFDFVAAMYDDGTHGDQAADGVFTTTVDLPSSVGRIEYMFFDGDTPELRALPPIPSTMGNRVLLVQGDAIGPIETFGRPFLMAEQTHPNKDGQAIIAAGVADEIEKTDAFRRFLAAAQSG